MWKSTATVQHRMFECRLVKLFNLSDLLWLKPELVFQNSVKSKLLFKQVLKGIETVSQNVPFQRNGVGPNNRASEWRLTELFYPPYLFQFKLGLILWKKVALKKLLLSVLNSIETVAWHALLRWIGGGPNNIESLSAGKLNYFSRLLILVKTRSSFKKLSKIKNSLQRCSARGETV